MNYQLIPCKLSPLSWHHVAASGGW